jgi:hypothetical protein
MRSRSLTSGLAALPAAASSAGASASASAYPYTAGANVSSNFSPTDTAAQNPICLSPVTRTLLKLMVRGYTQLIGHKNTLLLQSQMGSSV